LPTVFTERNRLFLICKELSMNDASPPPLSSPGFEAAPEQVPNHLVWAIIATVLASCLCCPLGLLGIVAIVYASKVNTLLNQGDLAAARLASATAKTWCWVASALAILGLIINILSITMGWQHGMEQYLLQLQQAQ
jgi:hypothetical protein